MPPDDDLDEFIEEITVDASGDEGFWSFLQTIEDEVSFPFPALLVGTPVIVTAIDSDGDEHRGLLAQVQGNTARARISILDLDVTGAGETIVRRCLPAMARTGGQAMPTRTNPWTGGHRVPDSGADDIEQTAQGQPSRMDKPIQVVADHQPRLTPVASAALARIIRSMLAAKTNATPQARRAA